ncbi:hypothetical protein E2C01_050488 [Portunus trituberculatus]|uniref:Ig-like domain-containing protein n=1 Tax=Portunus trituberculatus TaxID=210409 RepID=A0A5B7GG39_PORTR|nr:hypothetical protein [Portunus trituberculatus]
MGPLTCCSRICSVKASCVKVTSAAQVFHPPETEDWFLEISSVTFRDSGVYECQVSTSPKVSLPIHLTVLAVQQAEIPGPHEVFIQHGSTISLQCEVRAGVEAVGLVRWYHGDKPLNYSSLRGGISMEGIFYEQSTTGYKFREKNIHYITSPAGIKRKEIHRKFEAECKIYIPEYIARMNE